MIEYGIHSLQLNPKQNKTVQAIVTKPSIASTLSSL